MRDKSSLCQNTFGNTGVTDCIIDIKRLTGIFFMPKTLAFTAANMATEAAMLLAFQTATTVASKSARLYPFINKNAIGDFADNTPEPTKMSNGYGHVTGVKYERHILTFTIGDVGLHVYQQLFAYNGNKNIALGFLDDDGKIYFAKTPDGGAKGMPGTVIPSQYKFPTGSADGSFMVEFQPDDVDAFESNDKLYVAALASPYKNTLPDLLSGVHDFELGFVSATTTTATITAMRSGDFANMAVEYPTGIVAPTAWVLTNKATGVPVVPSGITINALGQLVFAGLTLGTTYTLRSASPAVLLGATILIGTANTGGYESNTIDVVTPAA